MADTWLEKNLTAIAQGKETRVKCWNCKASFEPSNYTSEACIKCNALLKIPVEKITSILIYDFLDNDKHFLCSKMSWMSDKELEEYQAELTYIMKKSCIVFLPDVMREIMHKAVDETKKDYLEYLAQTKVVAPAIEA